MYFVSVDWYKNYKFMYYFDFIEYFLIKFLFKKNIVENLNKNKIGRIKIYDIYI